MGKAWLDADYRISFAKNKTHVYDYYTLNLKNIYDAHADTMDPEAFPLRRWDQLANHVKEHTIENLQDLILNVKRHRSILWEIRELWRSICSLFQRRIFSKDIDDSLEKALDRLRESLD